MSESRVVSDRPTYIPFDPEHCLCSGAVQCPACAESERRLKIDKPKRRTS